MSHTEEALLLITSTGQRMHEAVLALVGDEALVSNVSITTLVALHHDGPLRANTIAELTGLTSGGATKLIDRLERDDLIIREKGTVPDDGRAVVVSLTASGTMLTKRIVTAVEPHTDALTDALIATRTNTE